MPTSITENKNGFTLLEVLIVVGIMVAIMVVAVPKLGGRNQEIKGVIRKLAVVSRDIRNQAKLSGSTYRLVIEMPPAGADPSNKSNLKYSYWVEKAPGTVIGDQAAEEEKAKEKSKDKDDKTPHSDEFTEDSRIMKKHEELPADMKFNLVELASREKPITEGRAYIYYLPQGYVEESAIQLSFGEKINWTIAIRPLTGRADIYNEHYTLKDVRPQ